MSEYTGYVDSKYLDLTAQVLQAMKHKSYELMGIQEGDKVLDIGCGPGNDTLELAKIVGRKGEVIGVDIDEQMVVEARRRAEREKVDTWVKHYQGDAYELRFAPAYFDACKSERVFIHLEHPEKAIHEMVRVTKQGGRIVVVDADWGTLSIDTDETAIERRLVRFMAEKFLRNGYSGKRLYRQFRENNLRHVIFEWMTIPITDYELAKEVFALERLDSAALNAEIITQEEQKRWRSYLEKAATKGIFFLSVSGVVISGTKP